MTCRSKIAKSCLLEIQDGHHGSHLENLFFASSPEPKSQLTPNMVGSIGVTCRSKIAKIVPIGNPQGGHALWKTGKTGKMVKKKNSLQGKIREFEILLKIREKSGNFKKSYLCKVKIFKFYSCSDVATGGFFLPYALVFLVKCYLENIASLLQCSAY